MNAEKQHINSFGHSFNPDFNREVSLAAQVIQSFAKQKLESQGKDNMFIQPSDNIEVFEVLALELKRIYASATRIINELKAASE